MQMRKTCIICGDEFEKSYYSSKKVWAKQKCCSVKCAHEVKRGRPNPKVAAALRGHKQPSEVIAKRATAIKRAHAEGRMGDYSQLKGLKAEQTSQWKGAEASYTSIHTWLRRHHPKTGVCEICGVAKRTTYAFKHHPDPHTRNRNDYLELCYGCHNRYDNRIDNLRAVL